MSSEEQIASAILLLTSMDGELKDMAQTVGLPMLELTSMAETRKETRHLWQTLQHHSSFLVTASAANLLRGAPCLGRKMLDNGTFCPLREFCQTGLHQANSSRECDKVYC